MIGTSHWDNAVLETALDDIFVTRLKAEPLVWPNVYLRKTTKQNTTKDLLGETFGIFPEGSEGVAPTAVDISQTYMPQYVQKKYHMSFTVTFEMRKFDLYDLVKDWTKELALAAGISYDYYAADLLNNCTSTAAGYVLEDGTAWLATNHNLSQAGTASNKPTSDVDFDTAALKDAIYYYRTRPDENGNPTQRVTPGDIICTPEDEMLVAEVLQPGYVPHEMSHTKNVAVSRYKVGMKVWEWLTDPDAWFMMPSRIRYNKMYQSQNPDIEITYQTDGSRNQLVDCLMMFRFGKSGWLDLYGSTGGS